MILLVDGVDLIQVDGESIAVQHDAGDGGDDGVVTVVDFADRIDGVLGAALVEVRVACLLKLRITSVQQSLKKRALQ